MTDKGKEKISLRQAAEMCTEEFTIEFQDAEGNIKGSETIWVRTQTHAELMEAKTEAAKLHMDLKKKYAQGTPDYMWQVSEIEDASLELLAEIIVRGDREQSDIGVKANRNARNFIPFDPTAHYANDEAREKAEAEADEREKEHEKRLADEIERLTEERRAQLVNLGRDALVDLAIKPVIKRTIDAECGRLIWGYQIFHCCRKVEDRKPYYASVEECMALPEQVQGALLAMIGEVAQLSPFRLRNSQGKLVYGTPDAESTQEPTEVPSTQPSPE